MTYTITKKNDTDFLMHHGIKGMKWGVRRYQNYDGTRTEAGRKRYGSKSEINKQGGLYEKLKAEGVYKPWFTQEELDRINGHYTEKKDPVSNPFKSPDAFIDMVRNVTEEFNSTVGNTPVDLATINVSKPKKRKSIGEFVDSLLRGW